MRDRACVDRVGVSASPPLASALLSCGLMAFKRIGHARLLLLLPGVAATIGAAAFGFLMLDFWHPGCRRPKSLTERFRLQTVAEAAKEYVAEEGHCPSGTG